MSNVYFVLIVACMLVLGCDESVNRSQEDSEINQHQPDELLLREKSFSSIAEYVQYVNDTTYGYIKSQRIHQTNYQIQYQPILLRMLGRLPQGTIINNQFIRAALADSIANKLIYFNVKISETGNTPLTNYFKTNKSIAEYFGYDAEKYFNLINEGDTLLPVLYHFENTYPQFPYLSLLLAFELTKPAKIPVTTRLIFNGDKRGLMDLTFYTKQIFNQPTFDKINETWQ